MKKGSTVRERAEALFHEWRLLFREGWALLAVNLWPILLFAFGYMFISMLSMDVVIRLVIELGMKLSGVEYVAPDTLSQLFLDIKNIPLILFVILFMIAFAIFQISGLLHACSMGKIGKRTSVRGMIAAGLIGVRRAILPKNWLLIPFMFVLIPLTGVLSFSTNLMYIQIPEFVRDYIIADGTYRILYYALYGILVLLELTIIFAVHFFSLEELDFCRSCAESVKLIRKHYVKTVGFLIITGAASTALIICAASLISEAGTTVAEVISDSTGTISKNYYAALLARIFRGLMQTGLVPVITQATLTVLFFQFHEEKDMLVKLSPRSFQDQKLSRGGAALFCVLLLLIGGLNLFVNLDSLENFSEPIARPAIVAHRGDSVRAPENTMPAFELAVDEAPEWVEFDVQQTKDGVVVVSHDDDLSRISGQKLCLHELTYAETQELDVGSWFSPEFSWVRLSTLDEVLALFRDTDIRLQIEIKISGYEDHLEEKVLAAINSSGLHDRCIITSLQTEPLQRIHELDPSMITTYSMFIAWNGVETIPFSDYFTIEYSNYTRSMVDSIHAEGKLCFAWTANTEDDIQHLIDCGVDGILTDNPVMLRNALDKADYTGGILRFLRLLDDRLRRGY